MKTLAIIAEYNPFHKGHKYMIEKSKKELNITHTIAIISPSFTQRGNPSVIDKWSKAKSSLLEGVDLVIELPLVFSCSNAEVFAKGGVKILESLNTIDYLAFGSEDSLDELREISGLKLEESHAYKTFLNKGLDEGLSFIQSKYSAIEIAYPEKNYVDILNKPNNILAIEYLKALKYYNSTIIPHSVNRLFSDHNSLDTSRELASSTAIRKLLENFNDNKYKIKKLVPSGSYNILEEFFKKEKGFVFYNDFYHILKYKLLDDLRYNDYIDYENGLENRIRDNINKAGNIYDLITLSHSKRHTKSRISRLLNNILLDIKADIAYDALECADTYIRILGSNSKGFEIIKSIKNNSHTDVIDKFSNHLKIKNPQLRKMLNIDIKATNIYNIALNRPLNEDFFHKIEIC